MMPTEQPQQHFEEDEISLAELIQKIKSYIRLLWRQQVYIWIALLITVPIGLLIAFGSQEEYTASTKILPYKSGGSTGGLGGLAGLAGIRLPVGETDQLISVDLYPELVNTLDFRVQMAETPIRFGQLNKKMTLVEYFQQHDEPTLLSKFIGLPGQLLSALRPQKEPVLYKLDSSDASSKKLLQYDADYLKIIENLGKRLSIQTNQTQRVTTSLTIEATMTDPVAAADLVNKAADRLMATVIDYEIRKVGEQVRFLEEQYSQSKSRFERAQNALAAFTDRNRGTMSATAQIEAQRLQSEYNLAFEIYRNFSTELEQQKIKQNQDTPVFTVLESVTIPNVRSSPKRFQILFTSLFLGLLFGSGYIIARDFFKKLEA